MVYCEERMEQESLAPPAGRSDSWADTMSDLDEEEFCQKAAVAGTGNETQQPQQQQEDTLCDVLLRCFPVPGEIWVHLYAATNYVSSLLTLYPPHGALHVPFIVNEWRTPPTASPYRICYATTNPALAGLIVTADGVVPNFSYTPRLAMEAEAMDAMLSAKQDGPAPLLVLPSAHGYVVRVFYTAGQWYVADDVRIEPLDHHRDRPLGQMLGLCAAPHCGRHRSGRPTGVPDLIQDLKTDRVWFFALYPDRQTLLALGTARVVLHHEFHDDDLGREPPEFDFTVHKHLAPSVPILPTQREVIVELVLKTPPVHTTAEGAAYAGLYDGVLFVNPHTMFAARVCTPEVVYLSPLLRGERALPELIAQRAVELRLVDRTRLTVDHYTYHWLETALPALTHRLFGEHHAETVAQIQYQVDTFYDWVAAWVQFVSVLSPEDWAALDLPLQRLYVLLDYESPGAWFKIIGSPRYTEIVAQLVVARWQQM